MSKYVIRNCPSFCRDICSADDTDCFCCNETDCPLKQIVGLCKEELEGQYSDTWNLVQKISKLLDIQEVE